MFAGICHVHYAPLSRILKSTAEELGLHYRESPTISGAFLDHLKWLRTLGLAEEVGFEPTVRFPARRFSRPLP